MTANSPNAYLASAVLHAAFLVSLFFVAYSLKESTPEERVKIFELVAGEGNNYEQTEAPALGTEGGVKLNTVPTPTPVQAAPQPEPEPAPVVAAPPEPAPLQAVAPPKTPPVTKPTAEPKPPDFAKDLKRISDKREKNIVNKFRAKQEAEEAARKKAEAADRKKATYEEYLKQQGKVASSQKSGPIKTTKIDGEGIAKGVVGGSTSNKVGGAGGKSLSREDQDLLDSYFALLTMRLREAHEKPTGLSDQLSARVEFFVSADGVISRVKIIDSSGSKEFDDSVLAAFRSVRSIGKRPDGKSDTRTGTFRMRDEE